MRAGVRWQDGAALTSRDVAFTYHAIMNPANTIPSRFPYDHVARVDTPDAATVVVTLKRPYSPIVANFFGGDSNYPILPAHLLAGFANLNNVAYNAAPAGSGPFAFERWMRGDHVTATASSTYYAGKPRLDRVTLRFIANSSTTAAELATGEVDATFFAEVNDIATLRAVPDHRIVITPIPSMYALSYNLTDPLAGDPIVRRAFALAIDRHALVEKVTHGIDDADTGMRGLFTWAYDPHAGNVPYDPNAAKALLSRAGWLPGPDGIREKNGRRLEITLTIMTLSTDTELAAVIAEQEHAIGIDTAVKRYPRGQFAALDGPILKGRFQITLSDYASSYDPEPSWLLACDQRPPAGYNYTGYCNAAVDRALAEAASTYDRATRQHNLSFVQRQLLADLPFYFLCQISEIDVIPSRLQGYDRPLLGTPFNSVARWRLR
jgi:peptide/nickel transport system substrate-binding protein